MSNSLGRRKEISCTVKRRRSDGLLTMHVNNFLSSSLSMTRVVRALLFNLVLHLTVEKSFN